MPHLLELFSGTGSIGKVFAAAGWRVTSVELETRFKPTCCMNVLDFEPNMLEGPVDLLWGSPPCTHTHTQPMQHMRVFLRVAKKRENERGKRSGSFFR